MWLLFTQNVTSQLSFRLFYFSLEGYLFDKEAILEYYLAKKKEISRKLKEYEKQKKREENEINELKAAAHRSQVEKFIGKTKR